MEAEKTSFVLGKKNFTFIIVGFITVILGYILMSGGVSEDPNVFNEEIFNTQRITVAPIVVLIGFFIVGYGVMIKPQKTLNEELKEGLKE